MWKLVWLKFVIYQGKTMDWHNMLWAILFEWKICRKRLFLCIVFLTQADKKNVLCATELLANCFENGIGVAANPERAKILRKKIKELEELNNQI